MAWRRIAKTIGKALRIAREKRGITQEEVARRTKATQPTVSLWESGDAIPSLTRFVILTRMFPELIDTLRELAQPNGLKTKKEAAKQ